MWYAISKFYMNSVNLVGTADYSVTAAYQATIKVSLWFKKTNPPTPGLCFITSLQHDPRLILDAVSQGVVKLNVP